MSLRHSRGFTLIEAVVVSGIAVLLAILCAAMVKSGMTAFQKTGARFRDAATMSRLTQLWLADEDAAWAIFTPPSDVLGQSNADGHELGFFSRDATQTPKLWSYTFDPSAHRLTRYTYASPGASPVPDQTFDGIAAFSAHTYPLTALLDATAPVYAPSYANAVLRDGAVTFYGNAVPWIAGGNQITDVRIDTAYYSRDVHLSTQSAPSGYTVVLNYTPAPSSSASPPPGLLVWPPAIRFAAQGSGSLTGATGCNAQAFTDAGFTTAIADGTRDPFGAGVAVQGPAGCYSGAVAVHETGYAGAFGDYQFPSASCSNTQVLPGTWNPTRFGPTAYQAFSGGTDSATSCALGFSDAAASPKTSQATAQVIQPCWAIGGTCTYTMSYAADQGPGCDPGTGETSSGYTGRGRASITPTNAGTWTTSDGGASYTFTRTAAGTVTVSVYSQFQRWTATPQTNGLYHCGTTTTDPLTSSFTIPSV